MNYQEHIDDLRNLKSKLIAAHRSGDGEQMRLLSQQKQIAKNDRRRLFCLDCNEPISSGGRGNATRCTLHYNARRYYQRAIASLVAIFTLSLVGFTGWTPPSGNITLGWSYPPTELTTNLTFRIYGSTNLTLPYTNWTALTNIVGTNVSATINIVPQQYFFFITASNIWGESNPSAVASLPALPRSGGNVTIQVGP